MSAADQPYTPISCQRHSEYELAIMRRTPLQLRWREGGNQIISNTLLPIDLTTTREGEFLIARTPELQEIGIRLDNIIY